LAVVLAALVALAIVPVLAVSNPGNARAQTSGCSYPFDNCTTTTTVTPSTTPGNTSTSTTTPGGTTTTFPGCGHGNADEHNPHCTTTTTSPTATTTPGNTTTTTARSGQPIIVLDLTVAAAGQTVRVVVCGFPTGATVQISFNGQIVGTIVVGSVPAGACTGGQFALPRGLGGHGILAVVGPLSVSARPVAQASAPNQTSFVVPDVKPDTYLVCGSAAGSSGACAPLKVVSNTSVLGTTFSGGAPLVSASNPDSFLAFTGLGLLRLLLLAGALIVGGWLLIRRSQERTS
jgi:hypothetical protein